MLKKTEIPKIGRIYDKLGHALIVLDEDLEINYFNRCAALAIKKLNTDHSAKKWKSIPGKILQKRVFFLVNRDTTYEEEIWIRMQIEHSH